MKAQQCIIQIVGNKAYLSFDQVLEKAIVRVSANDDKSLMVEHEVTMSDSAVVLLPSLHGPLKFEILQQQMLYQKTINI